MQLEPLEDRKLLTTSPVYVDDNWVSVTAGVPNGLPLVIGSSVRNLNDTINPGTITAVYGTNAFGTGSDNSSVVSAATISAAALQVTNITGTLNILEGTYKESDIVINQNITVQGAGVSGPAQTLIVPEALSSHALTGGDNEFTAASHSGFIIYAASVTIQNLHLDGSGNTAIGSSLNYHQGITTMYDQQAGGDYSSLHGGAAGAPTTLPAVGMGAPNDGRTNRTITSYLINHVVVDNTFYHGITLSAPAGKEYGQASGTSANTVYNSVVNNVGDLGNQDLNRVGILIQNFDNFPTSLVPGAVQFNAYLDNITNVGVGLKTSYFGTYGVNAYLNDNTPLGAARNKTAASGITVNNPVARGIEADLMEDSGPLSNSVVNVTNPVNNVVGFYFNRSEAIATNDVVNNAKIGIEIQNDGYANNGDSIDDMVALAIKFTLNGPANAPGSIGVLSTNDASNPLPSSFIISTGFVVHNYDTGVLVTQAVPVPATVLVASGPNTPGNITFVNVPANAQTTVSIDRPVISGNTTGLNFGTNVSVIGNFVTADPIVSSSTTTFNPGFGTRTTNFAYAETGFNVPVPGPSPYPDPALPTIITPAPTSSDQFVSNNLTLNAGSLFKPQLVQTLADQTLEDFTTFKNYGPSTETNPWRTGFTSSGATNTWFGAVTQDGSSGTIVIDPLGGNTTENGLVYETLAAPHDLRGYQTLNVVARGIAGNQAKLFAVVISSGGGLGYDYFMDTSLMHVSTGAGDTVFTTFTINLLAPAVRANKGDNVFDFSNITGLAVITDGGFVDGNINVPVGLEIDKVSVSSALTSGQFNVTSGSVTLNNAILSPSIFSGFVPAVGQSFTIVNKQSAGAVSGIFNDTSANPLTQGATLSFGGQAFSINYSGGDGNDVVLTRLNINLPPVVNLGGPSIQNFSAVYTGTAINITAATEVVTDDQNNIASLTISVPGGSTGDNLTASNALAPGVLVSGGLNGAPLVLTGGPLPADFTTVLRSVKYLNTSHSFPVLINVVANDGVNNSATATTTLTANFSSSVSSRLLFYKNSVRYDVPGGSNPAVTPGKPFSDDNAIATDKTAYLPNGTTTPLTATAATFVNVSSYDRGINGIMVDLAGTHGPLSASDFIFRTGNNNTSTLWTPVGTAPTVLVRPGAGVGGSDRVELIWPDGTIKKTWLEVIVKGNDAVGSSDINTGLAASDTFFYASAVGDTGLGDTVAFTTDGVNDELGIRGNNKSLLNNIPLTNVYDINRDGKVDGVNDELIARGNPTNGITAPKFIKIGVPPAAPEITSDAGVGSGLTAATVGSGGGSKASAWLTNSLGAAISSGKLDNLFRHLAAENTEASRKILLKIDAVADDLGIEDDVLDSLLVGLGLE